MYVNIIKIPRRFFDETKNYKSDTVWYAGMLLSNHNYGGRQIKAKWNNEEFGYFNAITKIANAILCSLFMFGL